MIARWTVNFGVLLLAATIAACAAKAPATRVVWTKTDGSVAAQADLETAAAACRAETGEKGEPYTGRFANIEWATAMLDCMEEKGFQRVEEPLP